MGCMSGKNFKSRLEFLKKQKPNLKSWLIPKLRRLSIQWPMKNVALNEAKVFIEIGELKNGNPKFGLFYICAECSRQGKEIPYHPRENIQVDHIEEIAGVNGFSDWDSYINSLFCDLSGLQVLCKPCHKEKTVKYVKSLDKVRKKR